MSPNLEVKFLHFFGASTAFTHHRKQRGAAVANPPRQATAVSISTLRPSGSHDETLHFVRADVLTKCLFTSTNNNNIISVRLKKKKKNDTVNAVFEDPVFLAADSGTWRKGDRWKSGRRHRKVRSGEDDVIGVTSALAWHAISWGPSRCRATERSWRVPPGPSPNRQSPGAPGRARCRRRRAGGCACRTPRPR